ncbi:hypothetical protein I7I53_04753 [Histoplasma capsulatum var. duboisii H88]|uniref:Uncharacterized protein n=1 Tax=Ajellomyces capsulatus (strain H88) TaxID=544711 RepID=A0A8A1LTM6_AJEC8|nr:hypothetical protein I7I53_04753 [Histoplasma capsulatum var. duboisii H88]
MSVVFSSSGPSRIEQPHSRMRMWEGGERGGPIMPFMHEHKNPHHGEDKGRERIFHQYEISCIEKHGRTAPDSQWRSVVKGRNEQFIRQTRHIQNVCMHTDD